MTVLDVIKAKSEPMPVVKQTESVLGAVRHMLKIHETGLLITTPAGNLVGIITEKDVMRLISERYTQLEKVEVWEVMSKSLTTIEATANLDTALTLMTEKHIHHLPIMEGQQPDARALPGQRPAGEKPVGMISLDDIIDMRLKKTEHEAQQLKDFIAQQ